MHAELERALLAVKQKAVDSKGLSVNFGDLSEPQQCLKALRQLSSWFQPGATFIAGKAGGEAACRNLILVTEVMHQHIRAGNILL